MKVRKKMGVTRKNQQHKLWMIQTKN